MKIAFTEVCINPSFPVKQAGFIQQVNPIYNFHDDLHARILSIDDGRQTIHQISCDALGFPYSFQKELQQILQNENKKPVHVTVSCTHTHFSGDPEDPRFSGEVMQKILYAIHTQNYRSSKLFGISMQCVPFEGVGKSRISNHKARVLLQLFTIYDGTEPIIRIMVHNCHPTIHNGLTPYFTSEYPGYVIQVLKGKYEGQHFSFLQGAAGDVSTRFTRPGQDYEAVKLLGGKLVSRIEKLMKETPEIYPLSRIGFQSSYLKLQHEFNQIDLSKVPANISAREREEIDVGVKVRSYLALHPERMQGTYLISCLNIGPYKLVFCPCEAFSSYIDCVDTTQAALVCYSNGYAPYMTGVNDDFITYECFTDTLTPETKDSFVHMLKKYGNH
jgi:hypothetical protein